MPAVVTLPPPQLLAALLSEVTSTMLDLAFVPFDGESRIDLLCWRCAVIPIGPAEQLQVAIASDEQGCSLLGARMFQVAPAELDAGMIDDTLRELVNMTAGMIRRALGADLALGLPRIISRERPDAPLHRWRRLILRTDDGKVEVVLFVSDPQARA